MGNRSSKLGHFRGLGKGCTSLGGRYCSACYTPSQIHETGFPAGPPFSDSRQPLALAKRGRMPRGRQSPTDFSGGQGSDSTCGHPACSLRDRGCSCCRAHTATADSAGERGVPPQPWRWQRWHGSWQHARKNWWKPPSDTRESGRLDSRVSRSRPASLPFVTRELAVRDARGHTNRRLVVPGRETRGFRTGDSRVR